MENMATKLSVTNKFNKICVSNCVFFEKMVINHYSYIDLKLKKNVFPVFILFILEKKNCRIYGIF